jgi:ATP-dependent Clp protease ATP-binding subunit ClpA
VRVVVAGDDKGEKKLGFVFPEGPVLPRPERDIIEAGKKRASADEPETETASGDAEAPDARPASMES